MLLPVQRLLKKCTISLFVVGLFVLFLLFAFSYPSYAVYCDSYKDCSQAKCYGNSVACINNSCVSSGCAIVRLSYRNRENVQSFSEAVKPYEQGINLSYASKRSSGVKNTILASIGLQKILFVLLKVMAVLVIGLVLAMAVFVVRSSGFVKFVLVLIVVLIFVFVSTLIFNGNLFFNALTKGTWNSQTIGRLASRTGFDVVSELEFSAKQLEALNAIDAKEIRFDYNGNIESLVIIELNDKSSMPFFNIGAYLATPSFEDVITLADEKVARQNLSEFRRYIFDEDRFVFIVTADKASVDNVARAVISSYPQPPSPSRLFKNDPNAPEIISIIPLPGSYSNTGVVYFSVFDEDLENNKIEVIDKTKGTEYSPDCSIYGNALRCYFAPDLADGINAFKIIAEDASRNRNVLDYYFYYDGSVPDIYLPLCKVGYINSDKFVFYVSDDNGVNISSLYLAPTLFYECNKSEDSYVCLAYIDLPEGKNSISIKAGDLAGNNAAKSCSFFYDVSAPDITITDSGFLIEDNIALNLSSVFVNGRHFDVSGCDATAKKAVCYFPDVIESLSLADKAGNKAEYSP